MRAIGENDGERTRDTENQSGRAYGEAGTSVPRERVWSKSPSRHAEDKGQGQGQRCENPRRILHTVPAVSIEADVRPIGEDNGGKVTKAKIEDPHTVPGVCIEAAVRSIGVDGGG